MTQRARLQWRCRRGMLELDLLLQGFLERGYDQLKPAQQQQFEALLALPDPQLLDYLLYAQPVDKTEFVDVVTQIRTCPLA